MHLGEAMYRYLCSIVLLGLIVSLSHAHFVFVVPQKDGKSVSVVFSDSLEPDEKVSIDKIASAKLVGWFEGNKQIPVECKKAEHCLTAELGLVGPRMVYGSVVYGISSKAKPAALLVYHPKAVLGTPEKAVAVGAKAELEVVPVMSGGKLKFRLLAAGEPIADAEGSVMLPGNKKEKVKTDKDGYTAAFDATGRYGVWLRHTEMKKGEHDGKAYEEIRRYATLVVDLPGK
jgi:uncharacterized GH25 family protein